MRVLFLAPQLPYPARSGAALRNLSLLRGLAQRHAVTLLCFAEPAPPGEPAGEVPAELRRLCAQVEVFPRPARSGLRRLADLLRPEPDLARRLASPALAARARELVAAGGYDLVHVAGLEMFPAGLAAATAPVADGLVPLEPPLQRTSAGPSSSQPAAWWTEGRPASGTSPSATSAGDRPSSVADGLVPSAGDPSSASVALLLDEHNAEHVLQRRALEREARLGGSPVGALYSLLQWRRLRRFEARALLAADGVTCVSEVDRLALHELAPAASVGVVPNAIAVEEYQDVRDVARPTGGPPTLLFVGKLDFRPNVDAVVWLCREVLPRLRRAEPTARVRLVGQSPTGAVRRLARLPGVELVGPVADDRPHLAAADVAVVPLLVGGGARLKLLQAMAAGLPVVSTTLGCEGVDVLPDEHLLVGDTPDAFAGACLRLLRSPATGTALAERARRLVAARYDWRVVAPRLDAACLAAVASRAGRRPVRNRPGSSSFR